MRAMAKRTLRRRNPLEELLMHYPINPSIIKQGAAQLDNLADYLVEMKDMVIAANEATQWDDLTKIIDSMSLLRTASAAVIKTQDDAFAQTELPVVMPPLRNIAKYKGYPRTKYFTALAELEAGFKNDSGNQTDSIIITRIHLASSARAAAHAGITTAISRANSYLIRTTDVNADRTVKETSRAAKAVTYMHRRYDAIINDACFAEINDAFEDWREWNSISDYTPRADDGK